MPFCYNCSKSINSDPIYCSFCEKYFHSDCVDLDIDQAKIFIEGGKIFICDSCGPTATRFFKLEKRVENCENKLSIVDQKIDDIILWLNDLKSNLVTNLLPTLQILLNYLLKILKLNLKGVMPFYLACLIMITKIMIYAT